MRYALALVGCLAATAPSAQTVPVGSRPVAVAAGDLDGDGDLDLVVVNGQAQTNPPPPADLSVLLNDGAGTFAEAGRYASSARNAVVAADFDGDGDADVAATSFDGVAVHLSAGGALSAPTFYPTAGANSFAFARGVVAADLDGDGVLDLAVANDNAGSVSVLPGVGDGTFGTRRDVSGLSGGPTGIAAGDLDGDADLDLAVVASGSGDLYVLLNPGSGAFAAPAASGSAGSNPVSVVAADLDGDGDLDLGVADLFGSLYTRAGNGDGTFAPRAEVPVASSSPFGSRLYAVAAADFDGDGQADLAAAQGSDGALALAPGGAAPVQKVPVGAGAEGVAAADLDGDGDADLASADTGANTVTVQLNAGGGAFPVTAETRPGSSAAPFSAWPNPTSGPISVSAALAGPAAGAEVVVYDALGRAVRRVALGPRGAGEHTVGLSLAGLAPGVYALVLRAGGAAPAVQVVTLAQ